MHPTWGRVGENKLIPCFRVQAKTHTHHGVCHVYDLLKFLLLFLLSPPCRLPTHTSIPLARRARARMSHARAQRESRSCWGGGHRNFTHKTRVCNALVRMLGGPPEAGPCRRFQSQAHFLPASLLCSCGVTTTTDPDHVLSILQLEGKRNKF